MPISWAPDLVREHGYVEAHSRPLVSHGKQPGGEFASSFRVPASEAWTYPSLELRTPTSWPLLILDVDGGNGTARVNDAIRAGQVPQPSWMVSRPTSGAAHAVWCLQRPVLRSDHALASPIAKFGRIAEYFSLVTGSDRGYAGVLTHNPTNPNGSMWTEWGHRGGYSLTELAAPIPSTWRMPAPEAMLTDAGRNCALFATGMKWAGSPRHLDMPVLEYVDLENLRFSPPLPMMEVAGISRSIERYRRKWIAAGKFVSLAPGDVSARQAARGRKSGMARRETTVGRDGLILDLHAQGWSTRAIASEVGLLSNNTVSHVISRDRWMLAILPALDTLD